MPKPIVCISEQLRQFLEIFRPCFSKRQWRYFVIVLLGLIECEERKTMTGLLRVIGERVSLSGLSRFMNIWPWEVTEVAKVWLKHFRQRMKAVVQTEHHRLKAERTKSIGRPKETVVTGFLSLDDSVHTKPKGRKMGGMGRHYSNSEKRVVNGHCLFTGVYTLLGQRCPLPAQMYQQASVCQQTQTPFLSKIDMAVNQIEDFEPVEGTQTHVLIDSWYHCRRVRSAAHKRGWEVSGALKSNRFLRLIHEDGEREWLKLSEYAARLSPEEWQEVIWPSEAGGQKMYAHRLVTWIRKLGPTVVLITCHNLEEPLKSIRYWGSTQLDLDAQSMVDVLDIRWDVETFFEYDKDLLGSDHYQVMTAQAVLRFWTLTACLMVFLEEQRTSQDTCGDVRHRIQKEHQKNVLSWFETQLKAGCSVEQINMQLGL
jgi:hypothetical protein